MFLQNGFEILAFPCNQFAGQDVSWNKEIQEVACTKLKAEFPIFDKDLQTEDMGRVKENIGKKVKKKIMKKKQKFQQGRKRIRRRVARTYEILEICLGLRIMTWPIVTSSLLNQLVFLFFLWCHYYV